MLPFPPPARLNSYDAKRYALPPSLGGLGMSIRRVNWNDVTGAPVAPNEALKWLRWQDGMFFAKTAAVDRVITTADLSFADLQAEDWTTQAPDPLATDWTNPNVGITGPSSGGSGGGSGGGGSGGGSDDGGGSGGGGGGSGGSGGGDSGGGGGGPVPSTRPRTPPKFVAASLTLAVSRTSGDACVPLVGGHPDPAPITDTFTVACTLSGDAEPGIWFLTITYGTPAGQQVCFHGTIVAGAEQDAAFSITAPADASFGVSASAYKPNTTAEAHTASSANMRPSCSAMLYRITATLDWGDANQADLDLYLREGANPAVYFDHMSEAPLALNQDAHPECQATPSGAEVITGIYSAAKTFSAWYNQYADCSDETAPGTAEVVVENLGIVDITVNGVTVHPGDSSDPIALAYGGYNAGAQPGFGGGAAIVVAL